MLRRHSSVSLALIACAVLINHARSSAAEDPRDKLVVSAGWVSQHVQDLNLVVLHVGPPASYAKEHIPGAQLIAMENVSAPSARSMAPTGHEAEMPDPAVMRETLQKFGISNNSTIVVYYSDEWYSPSTRVIYALNWAGLGAHTVLMQGGLPAWKKNGGATTPEVPAVTPGSLAALTPHTELIVDAQFVQTQAKTPGFALVDGRAAAAYDGVPPPSAPPPGMEPPQLGHIPGALSVPFTDAFNENGELRPAAELEALFTKAGVKPGDTVVGYCWIGQQATAMLFAARTLGHDVKLYDGSIADWTVKKLPFEIKK